DAALCSSTIIRATALARLAVREIGPSCAAPTVTIRLIREPPGRCVRGADGAAWILRGMCGQRIRKPHEIRNRQRLAARSGIDAGHAERVFAAQRRKRVAQRLAPLAEGRADDTAEQ